MQANFIIPVSEFNHELFEKIKMLLSGNDDTEILISLRPRKQAFFPSETREAYMARLEKARENIEKKQNLVELDLEELNTLTINQ